MDTLDNGTIILKKVLELDIPSSNIEKAVDFGIKKENIFWLYFA